MGEFVVVVIITFQKVLPMSYYHLFLFTGVLATQFGAVLTIHVIRTPQLSSLPPYGLFLEVFSSLFVFYVISFGCNGS